MVGEFFAEGCVFEHAVIWRGEAFERFAGFGWELGLHGSYRWFAGFGGGFILTTSIEMGVDEVFFDFFLADWAVYVTFFVKLAGKSRSSSL